MKGSVVSVWLNTIENVWGNNVKVEAMESIGWSASKIISPLDDIQDDVIFWCYGPRWIQSWHFYRTSMENTRTP